MHCGMEYFTYLYQKKPINKPRIMEILFYLVCATFGLGMGYFIAKSKIPKCNHKWKLTESGKVRSHGRHIGFLKVYECEHCLKMRKEQVEID